MFSVGTAIIYGTQGICKIKDITDMKFGKEKKKYYVLCPVYSESSSIFVPTDNESLLSKMHSVITAQEIDELIKAIAGETMEWISDDAKRKEYCSSVIKSGDRKEIMRLIRMLYLHQEALKTQKKHFHIADEQYLKEAEKLLHDEFSFVLGIPKENVQNYIVEKMKETA